MLCACSYHHRSRLPGGLESAFANDLASLYVQGSDETKARPILQDDRFLQLVSLKTPPSPLSAPNSIGQLMATSWPPMHASRNHRHVDFSKLHLSATDSRTAIGWHGCCSTMSRAGCVDRSGRARESLRSIVGDCTSDLSVAYCTLDGVVRRYSLIHVQSLGERKDSKTALVSSAPSTD